MNKRGLKQADKVEREGLTPRLAQELVRSAQEGIVMMDPAGRVIYMNRNAERISGWTGKEATGLTLETLLPLAVGKGRWEALVTAGQKMPLVNIVNRSGEEITLAITRTNLETSKEGKAQLALVFRDVTEEEAAQRLRSYFLANISHEFRTPLSSMKASVELLLEEIQELSKDETVELINSLHFSVTGLQTLIDNLLESVSIEAGRFHIRKRPTDLKAVVADAHKLMRPLLDRREQALELDLPADLPMLEADPMRLTQVLVNLISNASKYGPMDKAIELKVTPANEDTLKVCVCDQGSGITAEERENVFRRFVRLEEKDKAQYGVGLGLSVVKTIVESHGGKVGLDERPGGGSIFWFTLPLKGES